MPKSIICDTSIWLYTGRIGQIHLPAQLFSPVYATETVCRELDVGRLGRPDTPDLRTAAEINIVEPDLNDINNLPRNRLGAGERSTIAFCLSDNVSIVGLDDRQAREMAQQLGLQVVGTIGILLMAKKTGLVQKCTNNHTDD